MKSESVTQQLLFPQVEDEGLLTLKFETDEHSVDVALAANALIHLEAAIRAFSKEIPEVESLCVELKAVEPGSVELPLSLRFLKTTTGKTIVPKVRKWVSQLVELYRFLKGNEPKKVEEKDDGTIAVTNSFGANATFNQPVINVFNITNTPPVGDLSGVKETGTRAISILDEKRQIEARIERNEYQSFRKRRKDFPDDEGQTEEIERTLIIATIPILDPDRNQWGFVQDGFRFSAKVEDEQFLANVKNRSLSFQRGDALKAKIVLRKRYDPQNGGYIISGRKVIEAHPIPNSAPSHSNSESLFLDGNNTIKP